MAGEIGRQRAQALMRSHTMREVEPWIRANYRARPSTDAMWWPSKYIPDEPARLVKEYTQLAPDIIPAIKKSIVASCVNHDHRFQADKWLHQTALFNYLSLAPDAPVAPVYNTLAETIPSIENPYEAIIRAAFQTRIMRITNSRIVNKAHKSDAVILKRLMGRIVHDQRRHEQFYTGLLAKIFDEDPKGAHDTYTLVLKSTEV